MPLEDEHRMRVLRKLGIEYDKLNKMYSEEILAIGNRIPIGGSGWMDLFFKMEAVRGCITAFRADKSVSQSIQFGKDTSSIAIKIWNSRRESQVHRWENCCHDYIEMLVRQAVQSSVLYTVYGGK